VRPTRNQLRIIGGKWRGRKIHFPDVEGLRPTGDRIRETLFNWLAGWVEGANCLDLFAGSGALGFEASSRGARSVTLVDVDHQVIAALKQTIAELSADTITLIQGSAAKVLQQNGSFDILFLDPPFNYSDLNPLLETLANSEILKPGAWIYLESAADRAIVAPSSWRLHRHKHTGQVAYRLYQQIESDNR
jgi:16S rRNA (guanine966-N2)-methyltransferase